MTYGSYLVILTDGRHMVSAGAFESRQAFDEHVKNSLYWVRHQVKVAYLGWDHESGRYAAEDFRRRFLSE